MAEAALCHQEFDSKPIFHVFLNTVYGHEHLRQSAALAESLGLPLSVYVPEAMEVLFNTDETLITLPLGPQYLCGRRTAHQRVEQIVRSYDIDFQFYTPDSYADGVVPVIEGQWSAMTCPRYVASGIGPDRHRFRGPSVAFVVQHVAFPIFVPSSIAIEWTSVSVMFDESDASGKALAIGVEIALQAERRFVVFEVFHREPHRTDDVTSLTDFHPTAHGHPVPQPRSRASTTEDDFVSELNMHSLVVLGAHQPKRWWQTCDESPILQIAETIPPPS